MILITAIICISYYYYAKSGRATGIIYLLLIFCEKILFYIFICVMTNELTMMQVLHGM